MVISELPGGRYEIRIIHDGKSRKIELEIRPGQVTYFSFRGEYGYNTQLPAPPPIDWLTPSPTK
jgi:hypothetical protein